FADDHAHPVVDEEPGPELRRRMDLDPGEEPRDVGEKSRRHREAAAPYRVGDTMERERVYARVAQEHLDRGSRGRVALPHRRDIAAKLGEHAQLPAWTLLTRRLPASPGGACGPAAPRTRGRSRCPPRWSSARASTARRPSPSRPARPSPPARAMA